MLKSKQNPMTCGLIKTCESLYLLASVSYCRAIAFGTLQASI